MRHRLTQLLALGAVALMAAVAGPSARAGFDIQFFSDAALTSLVYEIDDDGPGDSNTPAPGFIGVTTPGDLTALNQAVNSAGINLVFSALSATSNAANPPLNDIANLTINGTVGGDGTLYILTSATDYTFPAGPTNYIVNSSASHTFTDVAAGTSPTFTSYFNQSNTPNVTETATGTLVFAPLPGTSSMALTAPPLLISGSPVYGLSNVTRIQLASAGTTSSDQFTGTTTVASSVPEPGSLALLFIGGSALVARRVRRRNTTQA